MKQYHRLYINIYYVLIVICANQQACAMALHGRQNKPLLKKQLDTHSITDDPMDQSTDCPDNFPLDLPSMINNHAREKTEITLTDIVIHSTSQASLPSESSSSSADSAQHLDTRTCRDVLLHNIAECGSDCARGRCTKNCILNCLFPSRYHEPKEREPGSYCGQFWIATTLAGGSLLTVLGIGCSCITISSIALYLLIQ